MASRNTVYGAMKRGRVLQVGWKPRQRVRKRCLHIKERTRPHHHTHTHTHTHLVVVRRQLRERLAIRENTGVTSLSFMWLSLCAELVCKLWNWNSGYVPHI